MTRPDHTYNEPAGAITHFGVHAPANAGDRVLFEAVRAAVRGLVTRIEATQFICAKCGEPKASRRGWCVSAACVARRKAEVVAAVNGGLLTVDEACERYDLTLEEFAGWQRAVDRSGMPGLRVTRIQHYRDLYERQLKY